MTRYFVTVDRTRCNGCGVCYAIDPTHFFRSAKNGKARVQGHGNGTDASIGVFQTDKVQVAQATAANCPVRAITVTLASQSQQASNLQPLSPVSTPLPSSKIVTKTPRRKRIPEA